MDKTLGIQDYLKIGLRRKWFFIVPFIVIIMVAMGYAFFGPKIYKTSTSTLIVTEQSPLTSREEQPSATEENMAERLRNLQQQVMSRSFIETIIEEYNLLAEPKRKPSLESVIESVRDRIDVQLPAMHVFNISFEDRDPVRATKIANRLTTLFIERRAKEKEERALETISFLDREMDRIRKLLEEQERKVSEFKTRHFGMLTEDNRLVTTTSADIMESDDLIVLYSLLERLRLKYTDQHPEIIRLKAKIAEAERNKGRIGGTTTLEAQSSQADAKTKLRVGENRLQLEQQLKELTRGYEVTQAEYQSLLDKRLQAELTASMEKEQKGQRFYILDEAKIPEKPFKPNLLKILFIGLLLAMTTGAGLVAAMEYLDTSFYKIEDLEGFTELPVIASIANMTKKKTFYKILEEFTERILAVIASIFNTTKKKIGGTVQ
jgi:succinoglycan biosynthesis transport protein ExoP